jgi:hypothetical protein
MRYAETEMEKQHRFWIAAEWVGLLLGVAMIETAPIIKIAGDATGVAGFVAIIVGGICGFAVILAATIQLIREENIRKGFLRFVVLLAFALAAPILAFSVLRSLIRIG